MSFETTRIVMLGHVDHGKSTLLGRLLLETGSLPEGRLEALQAVSRKRGLDTELAFAMDALQVERDHGITIDAAHVPVRFDGRSFVFVDAPGHHEFLRNMVTGASAADAAVLLIDAHEGVKEQSHRHAAIFRLLGLSQLAVVVNKMDLVDFSETVFRGIKAEFGAYLRGHGLSAEFVPVSARRGDNVTRVSTEMPWYPGPALLARLLEFRPRSPSGEAPLRFPVQDVYRVGDRRVIAGRVESGTIRVGDAVLFSPWNKKQFVQSIERWRGPDSPAAVAGESVGITLESPIHVERGQVVSHEADAPIESDAFDARVFWLTEEPLETGRDYRLKIVTQETTCRIEKIHSVIDVNTLEPEAAGSVRAGQIAEIGVRCARPLAIDDFGRLPATGRFVLMSGDRVGGGGILSVSPAADQRSRLSGLKSDHIRYTTGQVRREDRTRRTGHAGRVVWFTGLSGSGKSTLGVALERRLFDRGYSTYFLDGDNVRHGLSANLGFSEEDRSENVRRVGEVAKLFCDAGLVVIVSLISPRAADRNRVRENLRKGEFIEVHVQCPLEVCSQRDPKGLYKAAREGRIKGLTGVDAPYEAPAQPEIELRTAEWDVDACIGRLVSFLRSQEEGTP